jgi:hypothetical protein
MSHFQFLSRIISVAIPTRVDCIARVAFQSLSRIIPIAMASLRGNGGASCYFQFLSRAALAVVVGQIDPNRHLSTPIKG